MNEQSIVTISSDIMSGTPVFQEARVPVQTLMNYLMVGESIDDFFGGFSTVRREQVIAFLAAVAAQMIRLVA